MAILPTPRDEYARRLAGRKEGLRRVRALDETIGNLRLAAFFSIPALSFAGWTWQLFSLEWLLIPAAAFVGLSIWHARVVARRKRSECETRYYERCQARIEDRWTGTGLAGSEFEDPSHPYAADLDLFGRGSLFEMLSTVQTRAGERALASWLLAPASPSEIRSRQEAIAELRHRIDLREDLSILGGEVQEGVRPDRLAAWGAAPAILPGGGWRAAALVASAGTAAALAGWILADIGGVPFLVAFILQMILARLLRDRVAEVVAGVDRAERELAVLSRVLSRLEREPFASAGLFDLQNRLRSAEGAASHCIARLARLVGFLDSARNELFAPVAFVLLWRVHAAFAIEAWRIRIGRSVSDWLAAVGEIEALCALSGYAYEHPDDSFPEIAEAGPVFDGESVGHPLLGASVCVRNDIKLGDPLRVLVVSGSNMSGKSTLLRTVGANVVLALAGAPVRAKRLRLCPLSIGATLRIQDSLQQGTSRFYAEIKRLRQLVDLAAGPRPLLFLLDEILGGTNSHDRKIGAESVIRALAAKGAIGLVTTHDLALAETADAMGPQAANVHFEDQIVDGKLAFDYRLRPGVVRKSNALELMRAVGLSV